MTGVLIGPSGFNQVEHIVQIETISEFGVFFIMFFAGLEFAPDKLRKVWKTAIQVSELFIQKALKYARIVQEIKENRYLA